MIEADDRVHWSDRQDAYVARFDDAECAPSVAVANALTTALDGYDRPLFDHIDPDALDGLVASASESLLVTFEIEEAVVTVRGDGRVIVNPS